MSGAAAGRIVCPRCGANNFNTQAACWKCGAPLTAGANPGYASPIPQSPSNSPLASGDAPSPLRPSNYAPVMDQNVAVWAGIALAVLFPYFAVPVGIVFLMLDDRRRADIGRITIIWGVISTFAQILLTFGMLKPYIDFVRPLMSGGRAAMPAPTQPNANDIVPSAGLPEGFK